MTIADEMRLAVADMFKLAHRTSCYPDAMQFEAEMFADNVLSVIAASIRKAALEEANNTILAVRHWAATDFTPQHSGQRGEDFDRGVIAVLEAIRSLADKEGAP